MEDHMAARDHAPNADAATAEEALPPHMINAAMDAYFGTVEEDWQGLEGIERAITSILRAAMNADDEPLLPQ